MPQVCLPAGPIDAIRVALIDECTDLPICGPASGYIFNCFRNFELTTNVEDGEETILRNDSGKKCFSTRTCDELTNVGMTFELLNPDYELTNLLTGQALINDGVENIGWFHTDGRRCSPWLSVELFEQVPDEVCAPGHQYRRIVIPKMRFKPVPTPGREGQMRVVSFEAASAAASISAWGEGPFGDSPFDFSGLDADIQTHIMEFFDSTVTETLEGQCGFIPVCGDDALEALWTAPGTLAITNPGGVTPEDGPFCPDPESVTVTLEDDSVVTINLPDASVTIVDCNNITIEDFGALNPTGLEVIGVSVIRDGEVVGEYDSSRGLPEGERVSVPVSDGFMELLMPGDDDTDGYIGFPGVSGCGSARFRYNCRTDAITAMFYSNGMYDGTVQRTEVVTENGTFTVPSTNEQQFDKQYYPFGSMMTVEGASTYGMEWEAFRAYDGDDNLLCEWTSLSYAGTALSWSLQSGRCSPHVNPDPGGGGIPIVNDVQVTP